MLDINEIKTQTLLGRESVRIAHNQKIKEDREFERRQREERKISFINNAAKNIELAAKKGITEVHTGIIYPGENEIGVHVRSHFEDLGFKTWEYSSDNNTKIVISWKHMVDEDV